MVEVVWDAEGRATCTAPSGAALTAGDPRAWSTEDLLITAVAVSLMQTFLDRAGDLAVLGYVSAAEVCTAPDEPALPHVAVRLCVTVSGRTAPARVLALCEEARRDVPVSRWLTMPLHVVCDVEVLPDGSG